MHTRPWWFAPSSLRALTVLGLFAFAAPAAHARFLAADSAYASYRIPTHRWSSWTATLDATGDHSADPYGLDGQVHRGGLNGALGTAASAGFDSDRLQHDWNFRIDAYGARAGQHVEDQNNFSGSFENRSTGRSLAQRISLGGSLRFYPGTFPLGLTLGTSHQLDLSQSFTNSKISQRIPSARSESVSGSAQGGRDYSGFLSAGAGVGRVRDATPVFQAQVLEERLRRTGSLARPLADETRLKLAALYAVSGDIKQAHQRPDKYFWRELERILREDGALEADALTAYDVLRLLEPISIGSVSRLAGFFVGPQVLVQTARLHRTRKDSYSNSLYLADTLTASVGYSNDDTFNDRRDDVSTFFTAEIHRPLGPRWQADAYSSAAIREAGEFPSIRNALNVSYIVSDRWFAFGGLSHQAAGFGHSRHVDFWDASLTAGVLYFLEDSWALRLQGSEGQRHSLGQLHRSGGFQLGVTYVVSGFFEAPGLVGAMRPTPPSP